MPKRAFGVNGGDAACNADFLGLWRWVLRRMLLRRDMARGVIATALLFSGAIASFAQEFRGQSPDEHDVAVAYAKLREWVNAFETPRMDAAESHVQLDNASGVFIVLRKSGRVIGMGADHACDTLMLRRAAGKALNSALGDPVLAGLSAEFLKQERQDASGGVTVNALRAQLGQTLSIELEVAGPLTPLVGRTIEQLARKLHPGLDGTALRHRQEIDFTFPSQLRASNSSNARDPARLLLSMALHAGISLKNVEDLPNRDDIAIYSFRTTALAEQSPQAAPVRTFRGDIVVPQDAVTRTTVLRLADGIARHLMESLLKITDPTKQDHPGAGEAISIGREPLGIAGDYSIVADRYQPLLAPPLQQALAAFALNRYANAISAGIAEPDASEAAGVATTILQDLGEVTAAEDDPHADLPACAAIVFAVMERPALRADAVVNQLFVRAADRVIDSFEADTGFMDRTDPQRARNVAAPLQAMLAGALSRLLHLQDQREFTLTIELVRRAIDSAWQSAPQPQHVSLLPWIGWAETDYAHAAQQPLAHRDEFRVLVGVLHESRIGSPTLPPSDVNADLIGGFALTGLADGGRSTTMADAQTVRPAAWLARAVWDDQVLPNDDAKPYQDGHLKTLRFLIQLSVKQENLGSVRNPRRARGGLRNSPWDSDQSVPAQALGLITAVDSLPYFRADGEPRP